MQKRNKQIAYAMECATYLVSSLEDIDTIILHGTVARGDFDEESDVDLFIESTDKNMQKKIERTLKNYYNTSVYKAWALKGVKNQFSIISGSLDSEEWKDLRRAITNTGIILYGKYKSAAENVHSYTLFSFENIKPEKKRVAIFRKLFGYALNKKKYPGIIDKMNAKKVGKGAILIPIEHVNKLKIYFNEKRIPVQLYDFWTDTRI